ncbi:MAG: NAD-dependent epimerase/dehydratase family protein [Clostridia bacterium]|nr:NAD-dependent epimerase/dehydratase family protein [Clostridia bacterium]
MEKTKKKELYLVTGAAGFLGGTICRQLCERGADVRAFVLPNDPAMEFVPDQVEICKGDLCDMESLDCFFDVPMDTEVVVLHCASIVTVNPEYNQKVMDVNVGGTENVIKQCMKHPNFKKMVYVSSTGAIPELPKDEKIKEITKFDTTPLKDCYSQSKAIATQKVLDAVHTDGLNACVVHPSGIMGPEDYAIGETTKTVIEIINGAMPAGISGSFNLADVRDLAAGVISAADRGQKGDCYILGNETVSFEEFTQLLSEESGCEPVVNFLPINYAYAMAEKMEADAKKKGTKPVMTTYSVYNLARNNEYNSMKAKKELGYSVRSYRETIRDEVRWLQSTGKIPQFESQKESERITA